MSAKFPKKVLDVAYQVVLARHLQKGPWDVNDIGQASILEALDAMGPDAWTAEPEVRAWLSGTVYEGVRKKAERLFES